VPNTEKTTRFTSYSVQGTNTSLKAKWCNKTNHVHCAC